MRTLKTIADHQFKKYCDIVYREAGIHLTDDKRALLNARISKRIRELELDPGGYLELIQRETQEMERFLNAISTNHTFFFRESRCFQHIDNTCRSIWCTAASSGEEPYSLAAHCLSQGFTPAILATDISTECLEKGRRALYPAARNREIPAHMRNPYFEKGDGDQTDFIRVKAHVKRLVTFERFNLITDPLPSKRFDAILCRNVLIYFDLATKEKVVHRLSKALKKDGLFIIGGSESLSGLNHELKYIEPSLYCKNFP